MATIKLNERQLKNMIKEALDNLNSVKLQKLDPDTVKSFISNRDYDRNDEIAWKDMDMDHGAPYDWDNMDKEGEIDYLYPSPEAIERKKNADMEYMWDNQYDAEDGAWDESYYDELSESIFNKLKTGAQTFANNMRKDGYGRSFGQKLSNSWSNAKKNYTLQGQYDDLSGLINTLKQYVANRKIDGNLTINQLIGTSQRFGKMSGQAANLRGQMRRNGANEEE